MRFLLILGRYYNTDYLESFQQIGNTVYYDIGGEHKKSIKEVYNNVELAQEKVKTIESALNWIYQ